MIKQRNKITKKTIDLMKRKYYTEKHKGKRKKSFIMIKEKASKLNKKIPCLF